MKDLAISLKTPEFTFLPTTDKTTKNNFQQFTFSRHFDRIQLRTNLEQKLPSIIATALTVTKVAPAVFFAIEKLASALETILNAGVATLNCACNSLYTRKTIAIITFPTSTTKESKEAALKNDPIASEPAAATDKTTSTETLIEELSAPEKTNTPTQVEEEIAQDKEEISGDSPVHDELIADEIIQDKEEISKDSPIHEESTIEIAQDTPTENSGVDRDDDLDTYIDMALVDDLDEPVLPAPSNMSRYLTIGALVTVATAALFGIVYAMGATNSNSGNESISDSESTGILEGNSTTTPVPENATLTISEQIKAVQENFLTPILDGDEGNTDAQNCWVHHRDLSGKTEWCLKENLETACTDAQVCLDNPKLQLKSKNDIPGSWDWENDECFLFNCDENHDCVDTCSPIHVTIEEESVELDEILENNVDVASSENPTAENE